MDKKCDRCGTIGRCREYAILDVWYQKTMTWTSIFLCPKCWKDFLDSLNLNKGAD